MRYLRARRKEGFISVIAWFSLLGITLGVATLIIVMSVMNGFRAELLERILGLNGHINVYGAGTQLRDYRTVRQAAARINGVLSVFPIIQGQVMASGRNNASGALVRGIDPNDLRGRLLVADNLRLGSLDDFDGKDAVVIGDRLASQLGVVAGDKVTLISPNSTPTALGSVPRVRAYTVVATFNVGMYEYDSSFIFMPLEAASIYFKIDPGAVNFLEVRVNDAEKADQITQDILGAIGSGHRAQHWKQLNQGFFTALQVERNVMFLILTLIIVVAAFNIISSLIMLVKDKSRDIAVMRTMGATRGMILRVFLISGTSIGVIGTFAGFVLGISFAANIETIRRWIETLTHTELFAAEFYFLAKLPAKVDTTEVIAVVLMGIGLSILATLYPSWRAARLDPVEALRYE